MLLIFRSPTLPTSSMERLLFPTDKQLLNAWTTCSKIERPGVEILPLDDRNLQVHKVTSSTSHHLVSPPSGDGPAVPNTAWEAFYPKGSINFKSAIPGGFGFYLPGPPRFQAGLKTANEVLFSYSVMFDNGWDFVKGGKLPGICEYGTVVSSGFPRIWLLYSRRGGRFCIRVYRWAERRQVSMLLPSADVEVRRCHPREKWGAQLCYCYLQAGGIRRDLCLHARI